MAKRAFDLAASALGLVLLGPVLAVLAVAVRVQMGSPVLFRQTRAGRHGRPFTMYKFRTMLGAPRPGQEGVGDAARITPFGRWLRATSLDELPELLNVLRGDMSLVGPRPLLMEYLPLYTVEQARRHEVKPGITGWAQVNGRNAVDWEQRFALDVWYVDHRSLWLDLKILLKTAGGVRRRDGIGAAATEVMPRFGGTPPSVPGR